MRKCFDFISPNIAALCLNIAGIPETITSSLNQTIKDTKNAVCTAQGVSESTILVNNHDYWSGLFQGRSEAVPGWLAVAATIVSLFEKSSPI